VTKKVLRLFDSLQNYKPAWLVSDAVAALTLAAIAVPEQLATARLVGMPPLAGLLAFAAGTFAFAAFGANRFMSVGADSTIAPIMASALAVTAAASTAHYAGMTAALAIMVGTILLVAGLMRAGWIADLLSIPVTTGFLAGIAIRIIVGQIPDLLGIAVPKADFVGQLTEIFRQLPKANPYPAAIGVGVLACALLADRINKRIPGAFIAFVGSGVAVVAFGLQQRGTAVLGALPIERLQLTLELPTWLEFTQLLPASLIVALVCMMQTAAVIRAFPNDPEGEENVSRDFAALGVGSMLAGFIGSFAVDSSPPRTAVVEESGGQTQLTGLFAVAIVAGVVLAAADAFAVLPVAALSGVLIFIGLRIFRVATMREIFFRGGYEIWLVAASAAAVVLLPIQTGVTTSILLSLIHSIYIIARPNCVVLTRVPGTTVWWHEPTGEKGETEPGALVFAPGAPVYFTNADFIRSALLAAIAGMGETCRLVVIEAHGIIDIDFSGAQMLRDLIAELHERHIAVALARLESGRAQREVEKTGLSAVLGSGYIFRTVEDAIRAQLPTP
jgi:MFS superfamily sulfate permease-like transporter